MTFTIYYSPKVIPLNISHWDLRLEHVDLNIQIYRASNGTLLWASAQDPGMASM